MGCWNTTCFITNTPIFAGDEVAVFFVSREGDDPSLYLEPFWVYGEYDDYGGFENVHGEYADQVLEIFKNRVDKSERENLTWDYISEQREYGLTFFDDNGKEHLIHFLMTHVDTLENLLSNKRLVFSRSFEDDSWGEHSYNFNDFVDYQHKEWNKVNETIQNTKQEEFSELQYMTYSLYVWCLRGCNVFDNFSVTRHDVIDFFKKHTNEEVLRYLSVSCWIEFLFRNGRRYIDIPAGTGSQDSSVAAQEIFAELILESCERIEDKIKKESEEICDTCGSDMVYQATYADDDEERRCPKCGEGTHDK